MKLEFNLAATAALIVCATAFIPALAQSSWHIEKTLEIGGSGGMDYLTVDSSDHRLFVPRSTHTLVIDGVTGKTLGDIPGQTIAHGVALVPKSNKLEAHVLKQLTARPVQISTAYGGQASKRSGAAKRRWPIPSASAFSPPSLSRCRCA